VALDSSIGGNGSESYVSVDEADTRFSTDLFFKTIWANLSTEDKENWLRFSTRSIDILDNWRGARQYDTQALEFPRVDYSPHLDRVFHVYRYVTHPWRRKFEPDEIPDKIKEAVFQMTIYLYNNKEDSGALDGAEQSELSVLNGLVSIKYDTSRRDKKNEIAGQGSLSAVRTLISDYIMPLRWDRA
jgi:hypothetical protein